MQSRESELAASIAARLLRRVAPGSMATQRAAATTSRQARADDLYQSALGHTRRQEFDAARSAFEQLLDPHPHHVKGWLSYAQMAKKSVGRLGPQAGAEACGVVLRRGIAANPGSGQLVQALGLLALQQGQEDEARSLLQRAVALQPELAPVLRWKAVQQRCEQGP